MKIWPFDPFAQSHRGQYLSDRGSREGLAPLRAVRERVGDRMGVAIELHGCWNLPCALQIARALEPLKAQWVEEAISPESIHTQAEFARASPGPRGQTASAWPRASLPGPAGDRRGAHRQPGPNLDRRPGGAEADRDDGRGLPAPPQARTTKGARCTTSPRAHVRGQRPQPVPDGDDPLQLPPRLPPGSSRGSSGSPRGGRGGPPLGSPPGPELGIRPAPGDRRGAGGRSAGIRQRGERGR